MPAEAVWEARLVGAWIAANSPPSFELTPSLRGLDRFLAANGVELSTRVEGAAVLV
jgi:hypothetical protein